MTIHAPDPTDRTPPNDLEAEQSVLGACMLSPRAAADVAEIISPGEFYRSKHETIYRAIAALRGDGQPCDITHVRARLVEGGDIAKVGGAEYLHTLIALVPSALNAVYYARLVRDRALRRALVEAGTQTAELAYREGDAYDLIERAAKGIDRLRERGVWDTEVDTPTLAELLAEPVEFSWLVPGLIENGDRLLLTGAEGLGKTTLIRQLAVGCAAGFNPISFARIDPIRVLVVDCENPRSLSYRRYGPLRDAARDEGRPVKDGQMFIELQPRGIDLGELTWIRWLMRRVEQLRPDLLVIGPLYKMHRSNLNDEEVSRRIADVLDEAREVANCALIVETHSPHAQGRETRTVRPVGSSLWMRWPEFGYGIRPADHPDAERQRLVDLVAWRGPRDDREWPEQLRRGTPWPWVEALS